MSELKYQQNALIRGTSCWVYAGASADITSAKKIGFCDSFRVSKNLQLQRAQVCGEMFPVSIDPQGVSVQLSMSGFIPSTTIASEGTASTVMGAGDTNINIFNPDEKAFIEDESIQKIPYMFFYDKNSNSIVCTITDVIVSTFSITVNGGTYVKGDVSAEALTMSSGSDFLGGKTLSAVLGIA